MSDSPVDTRIGLGISADVALSPDGRRAYVAEAYGHRVSASDVAGTAPSLTTVDTVSRTVASSVGTSAPGSNAGAVALAPDGRHAYAATIQQRADVNGSGSVSVVDTGRGATVDVIRFDTGRPNDIAVSPDGRRVYVATGGGTGTLVVVDAADGHAVATVPINGKPYTGGATGVALSPDGGRAYVLTAASVVVVDTERRIATGEIPVGPDPGALAAAPDGHRLYVSGRDVVTVVDTDHDVVVDTVPLAAGHTGAGGIAVSGDGRRVCVAWWDTVSVLDTATGKVGPVRLGTFTGTSEIAAGMAVTPDGRQAYVAGYGVAVVDLDDLSYR